MLLPHLYFIVGSKHFLNTNPSMLELEVMPERGLSNGQWELTLGMIILSMYMSVYRVYIVSDSVIGHYVVRVAVKIWYIKYIIAQLNYIIYYYIYIVILTDGIESSISITGLFIVVSTGICSSILGSILNQFSYTVIHQSILVHAYLINV